MTVAPLIQRSAKATHVTVRAKLRSTDGGWGTSFDWAARAWVASPAVCGTARRTSDARDAMHSISIVLAVQNGEPLIAEQLEALAAQTYRGPWELIVVDNRSTDGTVECVRQFKARLPNLRIVDAHAKAGLPFARNVGVGHASGDYVLFLDHDDRVAPRWLEAMARAAETADAVGGNNIHFSVDADGTERVTKLAYEDHPTHGFNFLPSITGGNSGMRKSLILELGGFDERYPSGEDVEFFWRAMLAGHEVKFVADAMLEYRLRTGVRAKMRRSVRDAAVRPLLYREFRSSGMPRRSTREAMHSWVRLVLVAPRSLMAAPETRDWWLSELASLWGRVRGSVRYGAVYL
jgi:glycosyltransferase involved in cell wall biosynthesis